LRLAVVNAQKALFVIKNKQVGAKKEEGFGA
jgi:hypothetical protein